MSKYKEFCCNCKYNDSHNSQYRLPCHKCKMEDNSPNWYFEEIKHIAPDDEDFGLILNCAVRYAIGRQTYVPSSVCSFITPLLPKLSDRTLWCLEKDIASADSYGDKKIDKPVWMKLLSDIKDEISRR